VLQQISGLPEPILKFVILFLPWLGKLRALKFRCLLRGENEDLKNQMVILNKRIKYLESTPAKPSTPRSYLAVAGAGLPPSPHPTITTITNTTANSVNKKQDPKPLKMLQSLYSRASREIIVAS
jgi:hypothetical protein